MEDIFAQASLCYLTNRCDEGFELIYSSIIELNNDILLNWEEQEVFCLISMNIIERRYKSWINLNRLLTQTDEFNQRRSIEVYIEIILNEMNFYSKKIFFLIEKYLFKSSLSPQLQVYYYKIQGDIHFLLSQTSKLDKKLEHMLSSLSFYNQSLEISKDASIIYNKALLFYVLTEEYHIAKDFLKNSMNNISNENELKRIKSLLKYFEQL
jgi:hypothetical protein